MNVKAAAPRGALSGGDESSPISAMGSASFLSQRPRSRHVMMVPITSGRHTAANPKVNKIPIMQAHTEWNIVNVRSNAFAQNFFSFTKGRT